MSARAKYVERAPDAKRRAALAKVHCAKRDLRLDDDAYREILRRVTGKESAGDLNETQLGVLLDEFRRLGFRSPKTLENEGGPAGPQTRLAVALWKDLAALNVLDDPSEVGLRKFARRLTGVEAIEWADAGEMNKIDRGAESMEIARASKASGIITMNANVRVRALKLIEEEKVPLAAMARETSINTVELIEFLSGGRKPADFVARISEFLAERATIRHIMSEVSNELRGNAGTKLVATLARIVIGIRDASDETERQEISDHAMLYLDDIKWLIEIMARDQTIRSALKPGDRVVVVKSGGKTVKSHA